MEHKTQPRFSKYWICSACAEKNGWTAPAWPVTATKGLCGHCDCPVEEMLIPVVDYDRGPGKRPIHD